jgi:hypothetical protein
VKNVVQQTLQCKYNNPQINNTQELPMIRKLQYIAAVAMIAAVCMQTAGAQTTATASLSASANILSTLSTTVVTGVDFKNIATGQIPYINPTSSTWPYTGSGATIGQFTISGQTGQKVTFSVATAVLTSGGNSIDFLPELSYGAVQTSSAAITPVTTQVTLVAGPPSATIWVGGHLYQHSTTGAVPSAQASGTYNGTAVITIDYVL